MISITNDGCVGYYASWWYGDAVDQERFNRFNDRASASRFARTAVSARMAVIDRTHDHLLSA